MPYLSPKAALNAYLAALRAYDWPDSCLPIIFRKGPQRALRLNGEKGIVIVALDELQDGEQSQSAGNNWQHNWGLQVVLLTPDSEDAPEAAEDTRLDLIDSLCDFQHQNRRLFSGEGASLVGRVAACKCSIGTLFADSQQVFRAATATITYKTLKS